MNKKALVIVDIQNDFLPGGALPVKEGDKIIPIVNQLLEKDFAVKVATKDWHPRDHQSFASNHSRKPGEIILLEGKEQILWPEHCVQGTFGADFPPDLRVNHIQQVFLKGIDRSIDGYSTFYDTGEERSTGLAEFLKKNEITEIYVAGLATDYCVKYSVLDAVALGFKTFVITDACRAINLKPNDEQKAIQEMRKAGAIPLLSEEIVIQSCAQ